MRILSTSIPILLLTAGALATAQEQLSFPAGTVLSSEVPGGAAPGEAASKGKLARLFNTPMGANDGRLVTVYSDANHDQLVWEPKGGEHFPRDIFTRYSDDSGDTWSPPVNISRTADKYSSRTDWNGDGALEAYWGDSSKPNIFNSGNNIVVSWVDKYAPEVGWVWGASGQSMIQGTATYADIDVYPNVHAVPFAAMYLAVSTDGGATWEYGATQPPIQLTYGRRDAIQDVNRGAGKRWIVTWQEDPAGLQRGEAEGPGEGASGARGSKGTDVWFTWTADVVLDPLVLRTNRTPLTNQSEYDTTQVNGYPLSGTGGGPGVPGAGSIEPHASTRANAHMVNDGGVFHAIVAYEETKGIPDVLDGKTVQYHYFPFDQPVQNGTPTLRYGSAGTTLTDLLMNSRRVRFVRQTPDGTNPAIGIFWKQGLTTEGGPSDIMLKTALALDEATVAAAQTLNMSTNAPNAAPADLLLDSEVDPLEDARAHRAILRGPFMAIGFTYTWNGPLSRYTDLANYNFWLRRTLDGGATWDVPRNVSQVADTRINVKEPRLVYTAKTGAQDDDTFIAAWGTETNVYEGLAVSEPLDVRITRTTDRGVTWEKVVNVAATTAGEFESQLRINDDASEVYAVVMSKDVAGTDALYMRGQPVDVPPSVGTLFCLGDGTGAPCPCANESAPDSGEGCANSTGSGGLLVGSGSAGIDANDLVLAASNLPANTFAILFAGDALVGSGVGVPLSAGLRCIGGQLIRYDLVTAGASGSVIWATDVTALAGAMAGDTRYFQVFYRDNPGLCGSGHANLTNGLEVHFVP